MSNSTPESAALYPNAATKTNWDFWNNLLLTAEIDLAVSTYIECIEYNKCCKSPTHEFILVKTEAKNHTSELYIDRGPAGHVVLEDTKAKAASDKSESSTDSCDSVHRLSAMMGLTDDGKIPAIDRVNVPAGGTHRNMVTMLEHAYPQGYCTLKTLRLPEHSMTVADLALLVQAIHIFAPTYTARKHQCYWFAGVFYGIVKNSVGGNEVLTDSHARAGRHPFYTPSHTPAEDITQVMTVYRSGRSTFNG
jgi:hypothetical protein